MKKFGILTAGLCATLFFAACDSTEKQNTSAGAMGTKSSCCSSDKKCDSKCSGDAKSCAKSDCCKKEAAPGAVSDKKEGCASSCGSTKTSAKTDCSAKSECSATKSECSSAKTECTATKSECSAAKSECGAKAKTCPVTNQG
jgi:hypothetical protein